MRVAEVFNRALGVEGARVVGVEWVEGRLEVQVALHRRRAPRCSGCRRVVRAVHDHRVRRWRHLDVARCRVVLVCRCARVACRSCGVRTQVVPFARPRSRFTAAFEDTCMWLTRHTPQSVVAQLMGIDWETVGRMARRVMAQERACGDGLDGLRRVGVDEVSWRRGYHYLTVVACHDSGRVVWVGRGGRADTLRRFFDALGPGRAARLEAVSLDLGPHYLGVVAARAPHAVICADPFHVIALAQFALDRMRAHQWQRLRHRDPVAGQWIKGARFALRRGPGRRGPADQRIIDRLAEVNHDLYRAHLWCDQLRATLHDRDPHTAHGELEALADAAPTLGHRLFTRLAGTLRRHMAAILNTITHRITNGRIEALNSTIRLISHRARGFRDVDNLIAMVHLVCGRIRIELPT